MISLSKVSRVLLSWIALSAALGLAQEQPPVADPAQAAGNQSTKAPNDQSTTAVDSSASLVYSPSLDQPGIKELGGNGSTFSENIGLFHWGPAAVRSAEALYSYSSANPTGGTSGSLSSATFQANVAYTKRLRRSRVVLQYNPRVLSVNGQVSLASANQDSAIDLLFAPAPHLTIGLSDGFNFYGRLNTFNDKAIGSNGIAGTVSTPFLNGQQQTLLNSFAIPINYSLSARTGILVSPLFNYAHTTDTKGNLPVSGQPETLSMFQYGVRTQLTHAFSLNQSLGIFYNFQMDRQTSAQGTTMFHSFGITASRRLCRSVIVSGEAGGSRSLRPQLASWTAVGSASITKNFRRGSLQGAFGRDATFTGFLGSDYNNRAWSTYSRQFGRRMNVSAGGGYLNGSSQGKNTTGEYLNNRIDFGLSPTVTWSFGYVHLWQGGHGPQSLNGKQTQIQLGLRWTPILRPGS